MVKNASTKLGVPMGSHLTAPRRQWTNQRAVIGTPFNKKSKMTNTIIFKKQKAVAKGLS
jgi:hypothetical protein